MEGETADGRPPETMSSHAMRIDHLKTTIERDEYAVDADKVAEAIVAMLLSRGADQKACS
jgi:anti-sigma28 factor (negative regulator of flagellin synthesis)